MVAFASSGYVFANSAKDYKADTMRLVWFQNILLTIFCGGLFIFIKDKPDSPPSAVADKKVVRENQCKVIGEAFKETSYTLLCVIMGILYGCFISLPILLSPLLSFYTKDDGSPAYTPLTIAVYGLVTTCVGVMSSIFAAVMLQRT